MILESNTAQSQPDCTTTCGAAWFVAFEECDRAYVQKDACVLTCDDITRRQLDQEMDKCESVPVQTFDDDFGGR